MNFSIEKKGYSIEEVDSFIEDILGKYQKLQTQNTELEQKLATAKRLIRRFSDTENALKQNIADSKRAAAYMISDAKDRSVLLLDNARESCGEIISDLDLQIAQRMDTVSRMQAEVSAFKEQLFSLYSSHIEMIDTLAQTAEDFEYIPDYTPIADAVDAFEEAGEPDCVSPEFVEYPEESIFAELQEEEAEPQPEGFVLEVADTVEKTENEEMVFETAEATAEESDEYSQLVLDSEEAAEPAVEEISFDFFTSDGNESEETDDFDESDELGEIEDEENLDELAELDGAEDIDPEFSVDFEEDSENDLDGADDEVCEVTQEEFDEIDDTDYFKFLNDFINSDDGNN